MAKIRHAVMCCNLGMVQSLQQVNGAKGLHFLELNVDVRYQQIHFMNRSVVDAPLTPETVAHYTAAMQFPQILPYLLIRYKGEYLSYERKGDETRLHGDYSVGIGGHIDITDLATNIQHHPAEKVANMVTTIELAAQRELYEEAGLSGIIPEMQYVLLSDNEVGRVHAGFIGIIDLEIYGLDKSDVSPQAELINPKWKKINELKADLQHYEDWSAKLIGWLLDGTIL